MCDIHRRRRIRACGSPRGASQSALVHKIQINNTHILYVPLRSTSSKVARARQELPPSGRKRTSMHPRCCTKNLKQQATVVVLIVAPKRAHTTKTKTTHNVLYSLPSVVCLVVQQHSSHNTRYFGTATYLRSNRRLFPTPPSFLGVVVRCRVS